MRPPFSYPSIPAALGYIVIWGILIACQAMICLIVGLSEFIWKKIWKN